MSKKKFNLKDISVFSVGFVPFGANNKEFLLYKKFDEGEASMNEKDNEAATEETESHQEDTATEEVEVSKTLLEKMVGLLKPLVKQDVRSELTGLLTENTSEEIPDVEQRIASLEKGYSTSLDVLQKAITNRDGQIEDLRKQLSEEKSRTDVLVLNEANAQKEIAKGHVLKSAQANLSRMPKVVELADMLFKVKEGLGEEDYEWLNSYLSGLDYQLKTAGIFQEKGSTSPVEVDIMKMAEKIAEEKGVTLSDALLDLPKEKQQQLLDEMRGGNRG